MPIMISMLGTVPKDFKKELGELKIEGRIDTIQTSDIVKID